MKRSDMLKGIIGIGIFTFLFFLNTPKVGAALCSACCDRGPTPLASAWCTAEKTIHKLATYPNSNPWCDNEEWMGYIHDTTHEKWCCKRYYTYECGSACECSCPSVLQKDSNNWYVLDSTCTGSSCTPFGCYEKTSSKPVPAFERLPEMNPTTLGFTSLNHTGSGEYMGSIDKDDSVNDFIPYSTERYTADNKPFAMRATYTDSDSKIEAMYVWFTTKSEMPLTPKKVDLYEPYIDPLGVDSGSKSDFGFLIHWNGSSWEPYVAKIFVDDKEGNDWWVRAKQETVNGKTVFSIPWNDTGTMVNVIIYSIDVQDDRRKVILDFGLSFKSTKVNASGSYSLLDDRPLEGKYNIFLMGNDKFGFTPYDNYTTPASVVTAMHNIWVTNEKIRFYDKWIDSTYNWNLNFDKPGVSLTVKPLTGAKINVNWSFIPDPELPTEFSSLVLNMYKSTALEIGELKFSNYSNIELKTPFTLLAMDGSTDKIGHLDYAKNRYLLKQTSIGSGSITIDLGNVGSGFLYFIVTGFDKGGNVASSGIVTFDTNDWIITQGGLLYSNNIQFIVKDSTTDWSSIPLLNNVKNEYADLSTELVGIKDTTTNPVSPLKSLNTQGYMIRPYYVPDVLDGYYSTLKGLFDRRKDNISNIQQIGYTESISGNLSNYVSNGNIGYLVSNNLTVSNGFTCNGKAVFFVSGNLNINGNISNSNLNQDACIFVVGGSVEIGKGSNASGSGGVKYDEINAYILANGSVSILKEETVLISDVPDGLYIGGGIHSLSTEGVLVQRRLYLADRLRYPVLVVNHHSKYGILGKTLFGGSLLIQKTEVGIKPF